VELHNFAPNTISQAASFVTVCEGLLGTPVHWDLWVRLFRGELHTLATGEKKTRRVVRAGSLTLLVRDSRRELYLPCTMTSNNSDWEKGRFYLRNDGAGLPPYTGKVLKERPDVWTYGVSPPARQGRFEPLTNAISQLANTGLTVASVIANFHHRWIIPLMERELLIFEMSEAANPVSLACLRLLGEPLAQGYAATWERRVVNPKAVQNSDDLWSFMMLPDAGQVSTVPSPFAFFISVFVLTVVLGGRGWVSMPPPRGRILVSRPAAQHGLGRSSPGKQRSSASCSGPRRSSAWWPQPTAKLRGGTQPRGRRRAPSPVGSHVSPRAQYGHHLPRAVL
jgi:hypothetical protein